MIHLVAVGAWRHPIPGEAFPVLPDFEPIDVFLHPGEYSFGDYQTRIRTILGSCVAVTFWHPEHHFGAMCHYLLPSRSNPRSGLEGSYAVEVIPLIASRFQSQGLRAEEFQVKMFGGSNMFPDLTLDEVLSVGAKNIYMGEQTLRDLGFTIARSDLAGEAQRMVIFELWSGDVWVRQGVRRFNGGETVPLEPFKPRKRRS